MRCQRRCHVSGGTLLLKTWWSQIKRDYTRGFIRKGSGGGFTVVDPLNWVIEYATCYIRLDQESLHEVLSGKETLVYLWAASLSVKVLTPQRRFWFYCWMVRHFTDWLTEVLTDWSADWLTGLDTDWLTGWGAEWLTEWLVILVFSLLVFPDEIFLFPSLTLISLTWKSTSPLNPPRIYCLL